MSELQILALALGLFAAVKILGALMEAAAEEEDDGPDAPPPPPSGA